MAHAAELDSNNIVLRVIVVSNDLEPQVAEWCEQTYGGRWVQTSYNANGNPAKRYNYAGISYSYDAQRDAFIPPRPYPSWLLDDATCQWKAPVPMPQDGEMYEWDEAAGEWKRIEMIGATP
jgi:hypothetical protein